ncbi:hypothetical protein CPB86DRAFT_789108 [Serendipita vermifera]|nr:hypothetical protein CPB86DRAFT_789108 [Serendipita vermifera]
MTKMRYGSNSTYLLDGSIRAVFPHSGINDEVRRSVGERLIPIFASLFMLSKRLQLEPPRVRRCWNGRLPTPMRSSPLVSHMARMECPTKRGTSSTE